MFGLVVQNAREWYRIYAVVRWYGSRPLRAYCRAQFADPEGPKWETHTCDPKQLATKNVANASVAMRRRAAGAFASSWPQLYQLCQGYRSICDLKLMYV